MIKNIIVLILLSLAVIFGIKHVQPVILVLVSAHDWISQRQDVSLWSRALLP